ncbi:LOW QUALITY PROTEIN: hypothetical protein V1477_002319 [Vespula maculifrons]|uniref:Uncharacterized protein n=1 Tax=Vespula maculifrons TaxID=7453 RepID=A0ABD2CW60_VESMC
MESINQRNNKQQQQKRQQQLHNCKQIDQNPVSSIKNSTSLYLLVYIREFCIGNCNADNCISATCRKCFSRDEYYTLIIFIPTVDSISIYEACFNHGTKYNKLDLILMIVWIDYSDQLVSYAAIIGKRDEMILTSTEQCFKTENSNKTICSTRMILPLSFKQNEIQRDRHRSSWIMQAFSSVGANETGEMSILPHIQTTNQILKFAEDWALPIIHLYRTDHSATSTRTSRRIGATIKVEDRSKMAQNFGKETNKKENEYKNKLSKRLNLNEITELTSSRGK